MLRCQPVQNRNHLHLRKVRNRNALRQRPGIRIEPAAMHADQHPVCMRRRHRHRSHNLHRHPGNLGIRNIDRINRLLPAPPCLPRIRPLRRSASVWCPGASETIRPTRFCASGLSDSGTGTTRVTCAVPFASITLVSVCVPPACAAIKDAPANITATQKPTRFIIFNRSSNNPHRDYRIARKSAKKPR